MAKLPFGLFYLISLFRPRPRFPLQHSLPAMYLIFFTKLSHAFFCIQTQYFALWEQDVRKGHHLARRVVVQSCGSFTYKYLNYRPSQQAADVDTSTVLHPFPDTRGLLALDYVLLHPDRGSGRLQAPQCNSKLLTSVFLSTNERNTFHVVNAVLFELRFT